MKRSLACIAMTILASAATAQSSVTLSGNIKLAGAYGNGGTSPVGGGATANKWAMNDLYSALVFSGKEDLGGGLYAGFELASFFSADTGTSWSDTGGPFWSRRSVVKLGGSFGELYAGRSLTPLHLLALLADPWYWDGSAAQVGWQIGQANYTATSYLRTNNTLGYVSPKLGGFTLSLAGAAGEGTASRNLGGSLTYDSGSLSLGLAYDSSHGFFNDSTQNHSTLLVGAYDFGVVRPAATFTSSRVNGVAYKSYSLALTAPVGSNGLIKAQYSHLDDFDTSTVAKEGLARVGLGYQYSLSKRTSLFANVSQSKAATRTATNTVELGIEHGF